MFNCSRNFARFTPAIHLPGSILNKDKILEIFVFIEMTFAVTVRCKAREPKVSKILDLLTTRLFHINNETN